MANSTLTMRDIKKKKKKKTTKSSSSSLSAEKKNTHDAFKRHPNARIAFILVSIIFTAWWLGLGLGMLQYSQQEGSAAKKGTRLIFMRRFDHVFARIGALFVGIVWMIRLVIKSLIHIRTSAFSSLSPTRIIHEEHVWIPAALYGLQGFIRAWFYRLHSTLEEHIMSDHVVLASCVVAGLMCEIVIVLVSRAVIKHTRLTMALKLLAAITIMVSVLLCIEVYYTAKYHHTPKETLVAALLGFLCFQAPMMGLFKSVTMLG